MVKLKLAKNRLATADTRRVSVGPKIADDIYSTPEYQAWRNKVIERVGRRCEDPDCADPARPGRRFADHIVELRDGGAPFDLANGRCLCGACHTRKTMIERAKRRLA